MTGKTSPAAGYREAREIVGLAVPALGALVVEPLLLLADSAIVGHWSTDGLAGLGLAQTVLSTVVGLCIFLAYSTTSQVARALGAGRNDRALAAGLDAMWLGLAIGVGATVVTAWAAGWVIGLFGAPGVVASEGAAYLRASAFGLPAMLVMQAATGVVRGLQDTRTPLVVAVVGAICNVPVSLVLVFGAGWGVVGAAVGTVVCQWGMAIVLGALVVKRACRLGVRLAPNRTGIGAAWREGFWLLVRTLCLRAGLIALSVAALKLGVAQLAAHQIVWNLWGLLSNALDAIAIAAQAMIGKYLGASDVMRVRSATRRMMRWGVVGGTVVTALVWAASWLLPGLFSADPAVQAGVRSVLLVVVVTQPLAGLVYVLDGVLMGAGDNRYLAKAGVVTLAGFAVVLWAVSRFATGGDAGLVAVWVCWACWYMALRAVTLVVRVRRDAWMWVG